MTTKDGIRVAVVGGGAAGYFGAIACAEKNPHADITILEATHDPLDKVRISGGGRCNVTHNCFDPSVLVRGYPRGGRELRGPLSRFQPRDTADWFEARGVKLKAEEDGRMFPVSDNSATIIDCLQHSARQAGVTLRLGWKVIGLRRLDHGFELENSSGEKDQFDRVLIASGNARVGHELAASMGYTIVPCIPSLFTFKIKDRRLDGLAGLSVSDAEVRFVAGDGPELNERGPVLITHWGLSGPAILKLSAWGARPLFENRYRARITINWLPAYDEQRLSAEIQRHRDSHPRRKILSDTFQAIPRRLWQRLAEAAGIDDGIVWAHLDREVARRLAEQLLASRFELLGKGIFKEEFVTCGGVSLKEVDFRTMESKLCPGLLFAGEVLDIDGITGGYNFQSAWTTGWVAGVSII